MNERPVDPIGNRDVCNICRVRHLGGRCPLAASGTVVMRNHLADAGDPTNSEIRAGETVVVQDVDRTIGEVCVYAPASGLTAWVPFHAIAVK